MAYFIKTNNKMTSGEQSSDVIYNYPTIGVSGWYEVWYRFVMYYYLSIWVPDYIKSSNFHRVVGLTPGPRQAVRMLCANTKFSKTLKIFIFTTSNFFCVLKYKEKSVCLINHMFRLSKRINSKTLI